MNNGYVDEDQQKSSSEDLILENLKKFKIVSTMDPEDFGELFPEAASILISDIKRESETKFIINRTLIGPSKIDENAYILIEKRVFLVVLKG